MKDSVAHKNHILVVSQYFFPEQFRINDICSEWVKRGYKVTVLTGIPNYPQGKFYKGYGIFKSRKEIYNGIEVIRIPLFPRGSNSLMLILNYLSFVLSGFFWFLLSNIKADKVFIYEVSPMTQALPGVWYAKKRKIPCYIYVTDLWPENVEIITGIKSKFIISPIGKMVDYIYKKVDKIFVSSHSFVSSISSRGIPKEKIEFWPQYAEEYYKPLDKSSVNVSEIPKDDVFNIIFAGNIGKAQGLDVLIPTAQKLKEMKSKVRFNIVGDGREKSHLIELIKESGVEDMFNFIDKQPPEKIPEFMAVCDASLICLSKNDVFSMTIPAKTQSCLACGIPIIASADGEVQVIIKESGTGVYSNAQDPLELSKQINYLVNLPSDELDFMRKASRNYYEKHFSKKMLLDKIEKYLK